MGLLAAAVAAYTLLLLPHLSPFAGGADSSGYLNSARLLRHASFSTPIRSLAGHSATEFGEMVFQPLGFRIQPNGDRMVPTYPIGLPLHLLTAAQLVGWHNAAIAVNLLTVFVCGGLMWAFARLLGLSAPLAGTAVLLLWLCPLFVFSAIQPMSDLLALGWTLGSLYCALRARDRLRWALLCGLATSMAVLVRPTNALLVVPLIVALGFRRPRYLALALGGLPGIAVFVFYNWRTYGSPLMTGYGDIWSSFSREYVLHNLGHITHWVPTLLSPLILLALFAPFLPELRQRGYAMMAVWFVALAGFYAFYYHTGETWWYLRFILPAFPPLILAGLGVLNALGRAGLSRPSWRAVILATLVLLAAGWQLDQIRKLEVREFKGNERTYPDAAQWARQNLPAGSAIFCMQVSGAFFYYTDFVLVRWDMVRDESMPPLFTALRQEGRPVYAILYEFERPRALERMGGEWRQIATVGNTTCWQLLPPKVGP
jgi:hypothetical protein